MRYSENFQGLFSCQTQDKECSEARKNLLASLYAKSKSTPKEAK